MSASTTFSKTQAAAAAASQGGRGCLRAAAPQYVSRCLGSPLGICRGGVASVFWSCTTGLTRAWLTCLGRPSGCMGGGKGGGGGLASANVELAMSPGPCRDTGSARSQLSPCYHLSGGDCKDPSIHFSSSRLETRLENKVQPRARSPPYFASCAISRLGGDH